jgi:hypothetical protein
MQTINITLFTNNFGSSFSTTIFGRITRCCCKKHHSTNTMADEDDRWLVGWFSLFDSWSGGSLFDVVACFLTGFLPSFAYSFDGTQICCQIYPSQTIQDEKFDKK